MFFYKHFNFEFNSFLFILAFPLFTFFDVRVIILHCTVFTIVISKVTNVPKTSDDFSNNTHLLFKTSHPVYIYNAVSFRV